MSGFYRPAGVFYFVGVAHIFSMGDEELFTLHYDGGSLTMPLGNMRSLFGENNDLLRPTGEQITSDVDSHSRTRVIGQDPIQVQSHTRSYTQWPTSKANNAGAGKVCLFQWRDSGGQWTGRVTGTLSELGTFLNNAAAVPVSFRSIRGTKYGPFAQESEE